MHSVARPPLVRFAQIDAAIRAGRWPNAMTLAAELEVHPRTVQRDLVFLRDRFLAPLKFDRAHNGYVYTDRSYCLPLHQLTEGELIALFLAERLLQEYRHTPYAAALARAFKKITAGLPDTVSIDLAHLDRAYSFRHQAVDGGDAGRFAQLDRAIRDGRQLELLYWTASRNETTRRVVDPYGLASVDGDWYLICALPSARRRANVRAGAHPGAKRDRQAFRSPGRLPHRRLSRRRLPRRPRHRPAARRPAALPPRRGPLRPRTEMARDPAAGARGRRQPARDAANQPPAGGQALALSFGADCEVLEPAELREEILQAVTRVAERYATQSPER